MTIAAVCPATRNGSPVASQRTVTPSAPHRCSTTPLMSKKSTSLVPPDQCSSTPVPVHAIATRARFLRRCEPGAELEQLHIAAAVTTIVRDRVHQTRQQRWPQRVELCRERVGDTDGRELFGLRARRTFRFPVRFNGLRLDEAERHGLGEAGGAEHTPHEPIARNTRVRRQRRPRHHRERRCELVESVVTPRFFDEVGLAQQIDAERRCDDIPTVSRRLDLQAQAAENSGHVSVWYCRAEHERKPRAAQVQALRLPRPRIDVDDRPRRVSGADLLHHGDGAADGQNLRVGIRAALESRRGFRLEAKALARAAYRRRLEIGRLEDDGGGRRRHFGSGAAHHTGDALSAFPVRDDQHVGVQFSFDAVERRRALTRLRAARCQRGAGEKRQVVGVHRLAKLEVDVVGDVNEVADWPYAGRQQTRGHPRRRAADRDVGNRGREPRAQLGIVDRHRDAIRRADGRARERHRRLHRQVVSSGHFAREADHAEGIGAVGGDLEIDHGIVLAEGLDRGDLKAAQRQRLRDVFSRRLDVDEFAQPGQDQFHIVRGSSLSVRRSWFVVRGWSFVVPRAAPRTQHAERTSNAEPRTPSLEPRTTNVIVI